MTLHEAITEILKSENNRGLRAREIVHINKQKDLYRKKDGEFPEEWQIRMRVKNYRHLFKCIPEAPYGKAPTEHTKIFLPDTNNKSGAIPAGKLN